MAVDSSVGVGDGATVGVEDPRKREGELCGISVGPDLRAVVWDASSIRVSKSKTSFTVPFIYDLCIPSTILCNTAAAL